MTEGQGEVGVQGGVRGQFSVNIASDRCDQTELCIRAGQCG